MIEYIIPVFFILIGVAVFVIAMSFVVHEIGRSYRRRMQIKGEKSTKTDDMSDSVTHFQNFAERIND